MPAETTDVGTGVRLGDLAAKRLDDALTHQAHEVAMRHVRTEEALLRTEEPPVNDGLPADMESFGAIRKSLRPFAPTMEVLAERFDPRQFSGSSHAADPTTPHHFADWLAQPPDTVRALLRDLGR